MKWVYWSGKWYDTTSVCIAKMVYRLFCTKKKKKNVSAFSVCILKVILKILWHIVLENATFRQWKFNLLSNLRFSCTSGLNCAPTTHFWINLYIYIKTMDLKNIIMIYLPLDGISVMVEDSVAPEDNISAVSVPQCWAWYTVVLNTEL